MRALVTGAGGFVGHHLLTHLETENDDVIASDRSSGGPDLTDRHAVANLVADTRPEVIFHLGGFSDVGASWDEPIGALHANAVGTLHVLLAAADHDVDRVLVAGSADVYGQVADAQRPITEDTPLRPVSPYAASKAAADMLALQAHLGWGVETIRVRAFNHLGPGQSDRFVASSLAARIARNEVDGGTEIPVGNLSARRDFTDVRDVVAAYRLLVLRGEPGEVYNVCSGRAIEIADLAARLLERTDTPMTLEIDPSRYRPVDVPMLVGDPTRIESATGWRPRIALDTTLEDVLDDHRRRLDTKSRADDVRARTTEPD